MALRGQPHPNLPTPPISLKAELRPQRGPRPTRAPAARPQPGEEGAAAEGLALWTGAALGRAPGTRKGRRKAGAGAAGWARGFVLGFAVAGAARVRGASLLPSLGAGSGGDAGGALGAGSGAWVRRAASPWPRSGCRTGRPGCARSPSCSVRVAGGAGLADGRAGCGESDAPAAGSYRLGPACRTLRGVTARDQSGGAAAECGTGAAASAPRIPAPPRDAAPPPATTRVWPPPALRPPAPNQHPLTRKEGLPGSREDNRGPSWLSDPALAAFSSPAPRLYKKGLSSPRLLGTNPIFPPRKVATAAS